MNLALLQWMHLTELEERRAPSYYYSWEAGWQKGWRGGMSGRDPAQPLPSAPSRSTGGLWVGADVCGSCSAVPAMPMDSCHSVSPASQSPGTWPRSLLPRGAAIPSSRERGAARPHRLGEREGWGALPSLSAGPDCEQLRADKERWRSAGGRQTRSPFSQRAPAAARLPSGQGIFSAAGVKAGGWMM